MELQTQCVKQSLVINNLARSTPTKYKRWGNSPHCALHVVNRIGLVEGGAANAQLHMLGCCSFFHSPPPVTFSYTRAQLPCVYYYCETGMAEAMYNLVRPPVDTFKRFLLHPSSLAMRPMAEPAFVRISEDRLPKRGDLMAIDAEFVSLRKEDAEIRR